MCLCAFCFVSNREAAKTDFKLVLVFNRDEFYARPTEPLHHWSDYYQDEKSVLVGGQDRENGREGGSWLTVSKTGKLSALTNHLTPKIKSDMRGRGNLVVDFCKNKELSITDYFQTLPLDEFNPFNLLLIDFNKNDLKVLNNIDKQLIDVNDRNIHVLSHLSNSPCLDSNWLKSKSLSTRFESILSERHSKDELITKLFEVLEDSTTCGHDPLVAEQGRGKIEEFVGMEKYSAIKIDNTPSKAGYGTRSHAVILVDFENNVEFIEKDRKPNGVWSTEKINIQFTNPNTD